MNGKFFITFVQSFSVPDIDKKRQEIKEKILRKTRRSSNAYFGVALVIAVFAFLLLSSFNYGVKETSPAENQPVNYTKIETSNKTEIEAEIEKTEEKESKTDFEMPLPEGFNEGDLVKLSFADDSQSAFWSNLWPMSLYFNDSPERISGSDSLEVVLFRERNGWAFAEKVFPGFKNWSNAKFVSFWFKGNNTGLVFDVYVYFDKNWNNYVIFRFQDIYSGWTRFVFPTEKNIIKNGEVDWSKVWRIRISNNNKSFTGRFYFDDFAVWLPKNDTSKNTGKPESKTYGMRDTVTKGNLAVTLNRWYPVYWVESYARGNKIKIGYSRVDLTVKNVGGGETYLSFTPYKPVLLDRKGKIYEYTNVKIKREDGIVVEHPDQLKLGVLYPGTSRSGAIFFYPTVAYTDKVKLVLYLNGEKFEFVWPWSRLS